METFEFVVFEAINATEHQRSVAEIEIGEALHEGIIDGIALKAVLKSSAHTGLSVTTEF